MLLNESTRRLKVLSKKLGSCIERARPYYEAYDISRQAQQDCQKAAVLFQRANGNGSIQISTYFRVKCLSF